MMDAIVGSRGAREAGFTLVELMVTIVIGSILLSIAVPTYQSHIRKSRRTDAKTALLDLATREERFSSMQNAYTDDPANLGYSTFPQPVSSNYYNIGKPLVTLAQPGVAAVFTATATPAGTQTKDTQCQSFSIDSTGKQSAVDSGGNDTTTICWN
jgi:type IV pilus assembly protein PilE